MATPRSQRIGIWIIAIVLAVGTLASFVAVALGISNTPATNTPTNTPPIVRLALTGYESRTFDASAAKSLNVDVLTTGTGETIKSADTVNVSYFGWTADGKIFDSSQITASDDSPIDLSLSSVITGWTEGLTGQKVGSVLRLTIPAEKAYGPQAAGDIAANSPLEFIVEIHSLTSGA